MYLSIFLYLSVTYLLQNCVTQNVEEPINSGSLLEITCDGYIRIRSATYCRISRRTGEPTSECWSNRLTLLLAVLCNGFPSCQLLITEPLFADICPKSDGLLSLDYSCDNVPKRFRDKNEVYTECRNPCPKMCPTETCHYPRNCKRSCESPGLECRQGYLRDRNTGKCIIAEFCPVPGDKNQVYVEEGAENQPYCPGYNPSRDKPQGCFAGYKCKPGLYRDPFRNKCVTRDECPIIDKK